MSWTCRGVGITQRAMSQTAQVGSKTALCYIPCRARGVAILAARYTLVALAVPAVQPNHLYASSRGHCSPLVRERPCRRGRLEPSEFPGQMEIHVRRGSGVSGPEPAWCCPRGQAQAGEAALHDEKATQGTAGYLEIPEDGRPNPSPRNGRPASSSRRLWSGLQAVAESVMKLAATVRLQHLSTRQAPGGGCRGYRAKDDRPESG